MRRLAAVKDIRHNIGRFLLSGIGIGMLMMMVMGMLGIYCFGGFALPPIMGLFVRMNGAAGYSQGFVVFLGVSLAGLVFLMVLKTA